MENDTPTFDTLKEDATKLLSDIGTMLSGATDEAKVKIEESRENLKTRLDEANAKSGELREAGEAAGADLKQGFAEAFEALKGAVASAREKFSEKEE